MTREQMNGLAHIFGLPKRYPLDEVRQSCIKAFKELKESKDTLVTYFVDLGKYEGNRWAIVMAWMDYNEDDDWEIFGKVAYQSPNSIMQEYDIDWLMPTTDDGEINDTEIYIGDERDIDYLINEWTKIKKEV